MNLSVSALKGLMHKIYRFVNGSDNETIELEDGRKIKTLAGIEKTATDPTYIKVVKDYNDYAQAETDALNGVVIKPGDVIKVNNDPDKRLNKFYEVSTAQNLVPKDGYELFHFFPTNSVVKRESNYFRHEAFEIDVDKPLNGQSLHGGFSFRAFLRTNANARSLISGTVIYGIDETGQPYTEIIKAGTNETLTFRTIIEDLGDHYSFEFIASPDQNYSNFTIISIVDSIYTPERY